MKKLIVSVLLVLCGGTFGALAQTPNFGDPYAKPTPTPARVIPPPPPPGPIGPARGPVRQTMMPAPILSFSRWTTYTSEAGGYSVKFPGKPAILQKLAHPDIPDFYRYLAVVNLGGGRIFEVAYFDFKGQLSAPEARQEAAVTAVETVVTARQGKLIDRRSFTAGKCQVKEITLGSQPGSDPSMPGLLKSRIYYSGDKIYTVSAQGPNTIEHAAFLDQFLDSFGITGGCVDAIYQESATKSNKTTVEGELDSATGWQHFETPYGISFILPGQAELNTIVEDSPFGVYHFYSYSNVVANRVFSVEIIDVRVETLPKAVQQTAALDAVTAQIKLNLAKEGMTLGECTPKTTGTLTGRECALSRSSPEITGRAQIFATNKRAYILTSSRLVETTDETAATRFFSSFTITEK